MDGKTPLGFPVIKPTEKAKLATFEVGGQKVTTAKAAGNLLHRWCIFLHAVEAISETGWDGGYAYRPVTDGTAPSEHAAGMAVDWNAAQHGRGLGRYQGWNPTQVRVIRWALKHTAMGKCIRWGADYHSTVDPMHFEVISPAALAAYNKEHP